MSKDGILAEQLKQDEREYEIQKTQARRLLQKGSKAYPLAPDHKMTEAAHLQFRKAIEDYALKLADKTGQITRTRGRKMIQYQDIIEATSQ